MYRSEYECDFTPSSHDMLVERLAAEYVADCEAYDRTVCTGPVIDGAIMPIDNRERGLAVRNARAKIDEILRANRGIDRRELMRAISRADNEGRATA
jgi:hypothetical protein